MKKMLLSAFVILSFLVCVIPSVGMIFNASSTPIGNEDEAKLPKIQKDDGKFNLDYISEFGDYFQKHFAFRKEAITADAKILSDVFNTSNIDSVVTGKNDWLFYSSTIDDFQGKNTLSQSAINGVVHNLSMINDYVKANGKEFLFTIAPNKNTLYPDNMPYYYKLNISDTHNRDLVNDALSKSDINYVNLFDLFSKQNETLYLAKDSHWNNKGAFLAYNGIMESLNKTYDDSFALDVVRKKENIGDLQKMIFPASSYNEYNYYYPLEDKFSYISNTKSVEEPLIQTHCDNSTGKLYMYRDSFGNALLPFFASSFEEATFTKSFPMILEKDIKRYNPDVFAMELVERNISWLIERPPIFSSPTRTFVNVKESLNKDISVNMEQCVYSQEYYTFSGLINQVDVDENATLYIEIPNNNGENIVYECFDLLTENNDRGFIAYIKKDKISNENNLDVSLLSYDGSDFINIGRSTILRGDK